MLASWPLLGRDDELDLITEVLGRTAGPRAIVVAGTAGVGKTRLTLEALDKVAGEGAPTARVVASRAASTIPLGALVPLIAGSGQLPDSRLALLRQASLVLAARATPDGGSLVLAVDDAHLLDDASAALVHQLAVEGTVRLILTLRSGEPVPDAVSLLWKDGLAERLELQRLARAEVEALAAEALDGPVDGALVHHLWTASEGNPLYLRELLLGSVETEVIHREGNLWRLRGRLGTPPRLIELVEARVGQLVGAQLKAVDLLALIESLGLATLEAVVGTDAVEALERRGLITVTPDQRRRVVRLAHPLYGEIRRRTMPMTRARNVQRELAGLLEAPGARRPDDVLRIAILRLDADGSADPELLAEAARQAWFTYEIELEERLARAAVAAGAGIPSMLLLAEILRWAGRHEEAEDILSPVTPEQAGDDATFGVVCITRAEVLSRGLDRFEDALAVIDAGLEVIEDPGWRDELRAERGSLQVFAGDVAEGLEALEPLFAGATGRAFVAAGAVGVPALAVAGRFDEALALADRSFAAALEIGRQPAMSDPAVFVIGRCLTLTYAGRLEEAQVPAKLGYDWSISAGVPAGQAWFGMILGLVALGRGDLAFAAGLFEEAALGFRDQHDRSNRKWCLSGVVMCRAMLRDAAAARLALEEAQKIGMHGLALMDVEIERARASIEAAEGGLAAACSRIEAAARLAFDRGQFALEAAALHDLVRFGASPGKGAVGERLAEIAASSPGPLPAIRADHAAALAGGDAAGLEAVADAYEAIGARLLAAEAVAQAAAAHRRDGREGRSSVALARARELAAACGGAMTPALAAAAAAPGDLRSSSLTPRELEVAQLAAAGRPNRVIAQELFVSVRTVENQLQRAYAKLGVSGRSELRSVLGEK